MLNYRMRAVLIANHHNPILPGGSPVIPLNHTLTWLHNYYTHFRYLFKYFSAGRLLFVIVVFYVVLYCITAQAISVIVVASVGRYRSPKTLYSSQQCCCRQKIACNYKSY